MILFTLLNLWLSLKAPLTVDASPLPPGPTTNLTSPSYVSNPSGRGTTGLIISSIITLTLCVYTSIHLNIAAVNKIRIPYLSFRGKPIRIKRSLVYKIYWVAIALFAPEFVLYAACDQWMNARKLRDKLKELSAKGKKSEGENEPFLGAQATEGGEGCEMQDLRNDATQEPEGKKVGDWSNVSMISAFFVVMGGFAYQKSDIGLHHDEDYPHAILTPLGFLHLATHGYLDPSILNDNSISDRSKADWLGKLLVCAQALWMVVNCIARKAAGLPNTLIELNVVVHVVFTVIVYAIWWKKPLNINEPILLSLVGKEDDVTAPVELDRLIPEHIVAVSGKDGLVMGLKCLCILLQATESGLEYETRFNRMLMDSSDSDSDGEDAEIRSNNSPNQTIAIPTYDPGVNNREYAGLLGYEIEFPENLNLGIFTLPQEMQQSEFHKNNKPLESKQSYTEAIQALRLNEKSNPKGLLLLRGQFLYWNDNETIGCHCLSNAVFLSEQQLFLLTRLHAHQNLQDPQDSEDDIGDHVDDYEALVKHEFISGNKYGSYITYNTQCATPDPSNYRVNGPISSWSPGPLENDTILGLFTFLGVIYAACHLTAWNGHFPSFYERLLWRISCIVVAAGGPAYTILYVLSHFSYLRNLSTPPSSPRESRPSTPSIQEGDGEFVQATTTAQTSQRHPPIAPEQSETESMLKVFQKIYNWVLIWAFIWPCILLYVLSRAFIVVEAFISVRCLPAGAYETVDWAQFVPHF
jgi:hypothetical protein